jgi:glycosyltransferase involved in cell wall biosynthesis
VRVLFLHLNFPGQFRHLASSLAAAGHDVAFLCHTHYNRSLPGVRRLCMKGPLGAAALQKRKPNQLQKTQIVAEQYRQAMAQLEQQGWLPDVVVSHSGWGCGLHVKELWPRCRHVSYLEWWFDPQSPLLHHDHQNPHLGFGPASAPGLWLRNQALALELVSADAVVAPSEWQRRQLPQALRERCLVIYDPIDRQRFKPNPNHRSPLPLLTYGTRGMEPMRGFPELVLELPSVLELWPELQVEIAGGEGIHYAGKPPAEGSWKTWAEARLAPYLASGRVRWRGHLDGEAYVRWLQSSWLHVYLSQPFVASWSLLEALACGCPLVASDVEPVREFCAPGRGWLVDSRVRGFLQEPVLARRQGRLRPGFAVEPGTADGQGRAGLGSWRNDQTRWEAVLGAKVATNG